jgi:hypothetical protein
MEENELTCGDCIYVGVEMMHGTYHRCKLTMTETDMVPCSMIFPIDRARDILEADRAGRKAVDRAMAPRGSRP